MWTPVWSFAARPAMGPVRAAVVEQVDLLLGQALLVGGGSASLAPQDCTDALRDVARTGGDAVRVECDVDDVGRAVRLRLCVDATVVAHRLSRGTLASEEHVVQLARQTWREARVEEEDDDDEEGMAGTDEGSCPAWCERPLLPHQRRTLAWMRRTERHAPVVLRYAGNLHVAGEWHVDTESECFTVDPSPREAHLAGGVCADGTGSGKTAVALRLIAEGGGPWPASSARYAARGTLVLLPLNLVSQWRQEAATFWREGAVSALWLVQGKDLRGVTMEALCAADVVFTTFHFLRASKTYADLVDAAMGGRPRTRAALAAWARQASHREPVVEAVLWRRVVVDEIHQAFESTRDLRHLRLLTTHMLWGLSATPPSDDDTQQHLYLLLRREKQHHPNLLAVLRRAAVRSHAPDAAPHPTPSLRLVTLSEEERALLRDGEEEDDEDEDTRLRDLVEACTFVDVACDGRDARSVEEQFRAARERELATLRARADGHERSVRVLEHARDELACELAEGATTETRHAEREAHERDLAEARSRWQLAVSKVERCERSERFVAERLATLRARRETCALCMERTCETIAPCAHLFCAPCIRRHVRDAGEPWCPVCRAPLRASDLTEMAAVRGVGTKMARIGELVMSLDEPVILFVQWKAMVRGTRAFLRSLDVRVLTLDGNAAQRAATLDEFAGGGPTPLLLLLCLEEGFAGLHLPHVRLIVFAHAIVGDCERVRRLEHQAIARCVRRGQTATVRVCSFVVADCAEEVLWRRTHTR